jgi:hypothetical protein
MSPSVADAPAFRAWCDEEKLWVALNDGRVLGVPLGCFPRLMHGTPTQRCAVDLSGGGAGLHWHALDEDISVARLLAGRSDETRLGRQHHTTCAICQASIEHSRLGPIGD